MESIELSVTLIFSMKNVSHQNLNGYTLSKVIGYICAVWTPTVVFKIIQPPLRFPYDFYSK